MLSRIFNNRARRQLLERNKAAQGTTAREVSSVGIRAKVIRADGTVEGDRLVCYGHKNPLIHSIVAPLAYLNGWAWERWYSRKRSSS